MNWKRVDQRSLLARFFEHGKMKSASEKQKGESNDYLKKHPAPSPQVDCANHLKRVADTFSQAQQQRHTADYDNSKTWTRTDVMALIDLIDSAFQIWHQIRNEPTAQAYLISLLGNPKAT